MSMQTYALSAQRLGKYKGDILKAAMVRETLSKGGRQVQFPKNNSDTYVARRFVPYGASTSSPNIFFANAAGDRTAALVQAHQVQEGVTPTPDSIVPQDVSVVLQQYSCLYGFTDKTYHLYEDDIPKQMVDQIGQRVALVNEQIIYGVLKASTNQFYGGTGTSRSTVDKQITLPLLRRIAKSLMANHAEPVTEVLDASGKYNTEAVEEGFLVYCHTDMEADIRDLPNFIESVKYASGSPMPNELGKCERFRFITSPDLPAIQDAGAAVGSTGCSSTTGSNIDVYQFIVTAKDAWSQVAVRGLNSLKPTFLPPVPSPSDPHGQRGYAGTIWWKAAMIENNGWMAVGNVGVTTQAG